MPSPNVGNPELRAQLVDRRGRLEAMLSRSRPTGTVESLIRDVDAALEKMEQDRYGLCESCHDAIEPGRLAADPLVRFCLDHLTSEQRSALSQDLQLAGRIQKGLLPPEDLEAAGWQMHYRYQPLGPVSGDYCDIIRLPGGGGGFYFLLGDVSGKGVAASMLMAHLHAMFRSLAGLELPLDQLMNRGGRLFNESAIAGQFATLICGRADAQGRVELCSAGHLPVLVLAPAGVKRIESSGFPLGMFATASYTLERITLQRGESLLLFTDGVSESRDASGSEYGIERLMRIAGAAHPMPPRELTTACLRDIEGHLGGAGRSDDLTLMAIRRVATSG